MTAIINASLQVAEARSNLDRANSEHKKATNHRDTVSTRIQALLAEKADIAANRIAGRGDDYADGSRLQLLALDLEGLQELHSQAIADVTAAQANIHAAAHQVSL